MAICTIEDDNAAKDDPCLILELNNTSGAVPTRILEPPKRAPSIRGVVAVLCVLAFSLGFVAPSLLFGWPECLLFGSRATVSLVAIVDGDLHFSISVDEQPDSTEPAFAQGLYAENSEVTYEEVDFYAYGTTTYCLREFPETFDTCQRLCRYGSDGCFNEGFCMCSPSTDRQPAQNAEMLASAQARCSDSDYCQRYCREYKIVNGDTGYDWMFEGGKSCSLDGRNACICF